MAQQAPAGSARPLHASHTCSGDPRSTCGTGRAVREVPSIQQVPLLSMSRDLTTHKRARPTVDWARETSARHTRALQTRGQHAASVAQLERRRYPGRRFADRTAAAHLARNGSDGCRNRRRPNALSASQERAHRVRIDAVHRSVCSVSCHLAVVTRSPFSGRFEPIEISC